ncbi:MAG: rod shape-determining protein [Minisyncoccales bacterium]
MIFPRIGLDLGTCNCVVFLPKKGVVLKEPSIVAVDRLESKILAVGKEAKEMIGKTPDPIKVFRPLKDGVIANFKITKAMIEYFIKKVLSFRLFRPDVLIGVPGSATPTEKRAVIEAGLLAGARNVYLARQAILAALGAGIPIESYSGNMVVDIGGGTTEIAVISLGGIVCGESIRTGGYKIDKAIIEYFKEKENLLIGEQTAEEIKIKIGTALPEKEKRELIVKGRCQPSGLPRKVKVSSNDICLAISEILEEMVNAIKRVLGQTPPELAADIVEKGIILTGGTSQLRNISKFFSKQLNTPVLLAKEPIFCVARGTGIILEGLSLYKKALILKRL